MNKKNVIKYLKDDNFACGDYGKNCKFIRESEFEFEQNDDEVQTCIVTRYNKCELGLNIHQILIFYPRHDSSFSTEIDLGMSYLDPKQLRELANQIEKDTEYCKNRILNELENK